MTRKEILKKLATMPNVNVRRVKEATVDVDSELTSDGKWKNIKRHTLDDANEKYFIRYHYAPATDYNKLGKLADDNINHIALFKNGEFKWQSNFAKTDEIHFVNLGKTTFYEIAKVLIDIEY